MCYSRRMSRLLFGHRLDLVEWGVVLVVCAAVTTTLLSLSFTGPGVIFGGIPPGLGAVWLLRFVRPSTVAQPPTTRAPGEGNAFGSLVLFAVGGLVLLAMLFSGLALFSAPKPDSTLLAFFVGSGLLGGGAIYAGVRVRRGGDAAAKNPR